MGLVTRTFDGVLNTVSAERNGVRITWHRSFETQAASFYLTTGFPRSLYGNKNPNIPFLKLFMVKYLCVDLHIPTII